MSGLFVTVELGPWELHFRLHRPKPDADTPDAPPVPLPTPMTTYAGFIPTIDHSETFNTR